MCLGQLYDIHSLYIFLLRLPRHQNEGVFPSLEHWNRDVLRLGLSCFTTRNLFPKLAELEWQIFQNKEGDSFYTQTRTNTHPRKFFSGIMRHNPGCSCFNLIATRVCIVLLCYVLSVQQLYINLSFIYLKSIIINFLRFF